MARFGGYSQWPAHVARRLAPLSHWRVNGAPALALGTLAFAHPTRASITGGAILVLLGSALRVWARGHIERDLYLTQTGPYAFVRHPLYVGSFFLGFGFAAMSCLALVTPLFVLVFLALYVPKMLREDAFLRGKYGREYDRYAACVGAVLPRLREPWRVSRFAAEVQQFSWRRVFRQQEWKTWVGVFVVLAIMWALTGSRPLYSRLLHAPSAHDRSPMGRAEGGLPGHLPGGAPFRAGPNVTSAQVVRYITAFVG